MVAFIEGSNIMENVILFTAKWPYLKCSRDQHTLGVHIAGFYCTAERRKELRERQLRPSLECNTGVSPGLFLLECDDNVTKLCMNDIIITLQL